MIGVRDIRGLAVAMSAMLLGGCENSTVVSGTNGSQDAQAADRFCTIVGEQETAEQLESRIREKCRVGDIITNLCYWYALPRDPNTDQSLQFQMKRAPALIARFCDMSKQIVIQGADNFVCHLGAKREVF